MGHAILSKECCEASLPPETAKAMKREAKGNAQGMNTSCCTPSSPLLLQSQLCRGPGGDRSPQLSRAACASPPDHTCDCSEVKKCQHQPKLQRHLVGRIVGTVLLHTGKLGPCRASTFTSWAQCVSLEPEGQPAIWEEDTDPEIIPVPTCSCIRASPSTIDQPKAWGDPSALKY